MSKRFLWNESDFVVASILFLHLLTTTVYYNMSAQRLLQTLTIIMSSLIQFHSPLPTHNGISVYHVLNESFPPPDLRFKDIDSPEDDSQEATNSFVDDVIAMFRDAYGKKLDPVRIDFKRLIFEIPIISSKGRDSHFQTFCICITIT